MNLEQIWKSGKLDGGDMWLLCIDQVDNRTWSVYASRPREFAGRVEEDSITDAVTELVRQIQAGETVKTK